MKVRQLLLETLQDLGDKDYQAFQWYCTTENMGGVKPLPKSRLEKASRIETVSKLTESYGENLALSVTTEILMKICQNNLAEKLKNKYADGTSTFSSAQSPPTAAAAAAAVATAAAAAAAEAAATAAAEAAAPAASAAAAAAAATAAAEAAAAAAAAAEAAAAAAEAAAAAAAASAAGAAASAAGAAEVLAAASPAATMSAQQESMIFAPMVSSSTTGSWNIFIVKEYKPHETHQDN